MELVGLGELSRRQAAKELTTGYATLKRLLDSQMQPLFPQFQMSLCYSQSSNVGAIEIHTPRCYTDIIAEQQILTFSLDDNKSYNRPYYKGLPFERR